MLLFPLCILDKNTSMASPLSHTHTHTHAHMREVLRQENVAMIECMREKKLMPNWPQLQRRAHSTQARWNSTLIQSSSEPEEAAHFLTCRGRCFVFPQAERGKSAHKKSSILGIIKSFPFTPHAHVKQGLSAKAYGSTHGNHKEAKTQAHSEFSPSCYGCESNCRLRFQRYAVKFNRLSIVQ